MQQNHRFRRKRELIPLPAQPFLRLMFCLPLSCLLIPAPAAAASSFCAPHARGNTLASGFTDTKIFRSAVSPACFIDKKDLPFGRSFLHSFCFETGCFSFLSRQRDPLERVRRRADGGYKLHRRAGEGQPVCFVFTGLALTGGPQFTKIK